MDDDEECLQWPFTSCCLSSGSRYFVVTVVSRNDGEESFQETMERTLAQDIAKIVESLENSTEIMRKEITAAEQRAEMRRREWEEQSARWKCEEDQRQIADSIKKSHEQLAQVIQSWATVVSVEQFFKGVEERASALSEAQREEILERLQLAREFIGT